MQCDDVKFATKPTAGQLSHPHVAPHEVALKFVPFSDKLFEKIHRIILPWGLRLPSGSAIAFVVNTILRSRRAHPARCEAGRQIST